MGRAYRGAAMGSNLDHLTTLSFPGVDQIAAIDPQVAIAQAVRTVPVYSNFRHSHQCNTNTGPLPTRRSACVKLAYPNERPRE